MTQLAVPSTPPYEYIQTNQQEAQIVTTVPSSPSNGHPLQTAWTFWYDRKVRVTQSNGQRKESDMTTILMDSAHYAKNLKEIHTFDTVEEFFRGWTFIKKPSELPIDFNISMFRKGCKPMWEEFRKGGMWIIRIKRGQTIEASTGRGKKKNKEISLIDVMWENLVLACVGELFAMPEVVGTVLSVRSKENVLSVWNVDNDNAAVRFRVGQKLREICALPANSLMRYKDFQQAMKDCSSYRNAQRFIFTNDKCDPHFNPPKKLGSTATFQPSFAPCSFSALESQTVAVTLPSNIK